MKHAEKNEADILLRALAKESRLATDLNQDDGEDDALHLDADELNSYAEDALPQVTRARYTSHIADCARCRKLIASLTMSGNQQEVAAPADSTPAKSFWEKLSSFLAPPVWRYATPVLALSLLIVVGLITLRQFREENLVASNEPRNTELRSRQAEAVGDKTASPSSAETEQSQPNETARSSGSPTAEKTAPTDESKSALAKEQASRGQQAQDRESGKQLPKTVDETVTVVQPTYAPEPVASTPPPPKQVAIARPTEVNENKQEKLKRDTVGERDQRAGARKDVDQADDAATRPAKNQPAPAAGRAAARSEESSGADNQAKRRADSSAATRSVAGRQFRREGNAWIDTAFSSGSSATQVKRGSEQFRALIADEPGLKTVTDQLSGVVVVVWKGRAYRIQ